MNGVEKGRRGEDFAAAFLLERGYRVLERNWRRKTGEIDIIAVQGDMLVFCEVKSRRSFAFGAGAEAVDRRKQLRIINTAMLYMQKLGYSNRPCRFDIIEVYLEGQEYPRMNQIINAFGL